MLCLRFNRTYIVHVNATADRPAEDDVADLEDGAKDAGDDAQRTSLAEDHRRKRRKKEALVDGSMAIGAQQLLVACL